MADVEGYMPCKEGGVAVHESMRGSCNIFIYSSAIRATGT